MTEKELEKMAAHIEARARTYEGFGENHTAAQWAKRLGLPRNSLWRYLKKGLTIEEVVRVRRINYPAT